MKYAVVCLKDVITIGTIVLCAYTCLQYVLGVRVGVQYLPYVVARFLPSYDCFNCMQCNL